MLIRFRKHSSDWLITLCVFPCISSSLSASSLLSAVWLRGWGWQWSLIQNRWYHHLNWPKHRSLDVRNCAKNQRVRLGAIKPLWKYVLSSVWEKLNLSFCVLKLSVWCLSPPVRYQSGAKHRVWFIWGQQRADEGERNSWILIYNF